MFRAELLSRPTTARVWRLPELQSRGAAEIAPTQLTGTAPRDPPNTPMGPPPPSAPPNAPPNTLQGTPPKNTPQ